MSHRHQILANTLVLYARTLVTAGLTLLGSRWVLRALGAEGFGMYSLIASVVAMTTFVSGILGTSVARHLAYAIGEANPDETRRWFNAAVGVHLSLAIIVTIVGAPIAYWFIQNHMATSGERMETLHWVFAASLGGGLSSMVAVSFAALFQAHQRFSEPALIGMGQAVAAFCLAFYLDQSSNKNLLSYAIPMGLIMIAAQAICAIRARTLFAGCRVCYSELWDSKKTKALLHFAGWNLFGGLGGTLRDNGSAVLLNIEFGPKVNAAYGVATQVAQGCNQLALALMSALAPEMASCEGRGDRDRLILLAQRMNKFGTLAVMLFAIPLSLEMESVLQLWLITPPPWAASFCRLVLLVFLIDRLSSGYMLAVSAHGRISAYQATLGSTLIASLPLAWFFLKLGASPLAVYWASLVTISICSIGRVFWCQRLLNASIWQWGRETLLPCAGTALTMLASGYAVKTILTGTTGSILAILGSVTAGVAASCLLALTRTERKLIKQLLKMPSKCQLQ